MKLIEYNCFVKDKNGFYVFDSVIIAKSVLLAGDTYARKYNQSDASVQRQISNGKIKFEEKTTN